MGNTTQATRSAWPGVMLALLAGLAGCAQTGGTRSEAISSCQGLKLVLANPPQASSCAVRSSLAQLASGRALYTVLDAVEPQQDMRLVRIDSAWLRLEPVADSEADAARAQRVAQSVIRP